MTEARRPSHANIGTELLVILGVVGMASAGAIVARRLRSKATGASQAPGTSEATGTVTSLIGHEFSFSGHTFHILESAREADDGTTLRLDYSAPPRAKVSKHTHRNQEESFEVLSGKLGLRVGGRELILTAGQSAIGPPRVPHAWWNPSDEERVRFVAGIRPGLEVEEMLETVLGLMREGKSIGPIPRNPLQLAVLANEIGSWLVMTPVGQVLFAPVSWLAFVGRMIGYEARYPKYSGPETIRKDKGR